MIAIALLSSVGLLLSVYFALVYHGLVKSDARFIPSFCRMENDSCLSIIRTREARIIGIPNFYMGILFYLAILAVAFFPELSPWILDSLKIASGFTVFVGIVLSYSLLYVIKKKCILCFTAHILNLLIFVFLLFA
jgi:uncharacterized membrane protein